MEGCILLTGAGSGIGMATAELLLERAPGITVGALDLSTTAVDGLGARFPGRVRAVACDVSQQSAVHAAVKEVVGGQRVRGLVCAAGILRSRASIDMSDKEWREMLGVHLDGAFFTAQAAARLMIEGGQPSSIVLFGSVAMDFGWPERLPYAVSKAGIGALTRTLAVEWAQHNIRVNAVAPGYVNTPMVQDAVKAGVFDGKARADIHALKRFADPREISEVIEFLLSERASFMTGEVVRVDGGFSVFK